MQHSTAGNADISQEQENAKGKGVRERVGVEEGGGREGGRHKNKIIQLLCEDKIDVHITRERLVMLKSWQGLKVDQE